MDGKEFLSEVFKPWIERCKWGAALLVLFAILIVCKLVGVTIRGGFETPFLLLLVAGLLAYAFAHWAYSRRDPNWQAVCKYMYGIYPDDKSVLDYLTFKHNGPKLLGIAFVILILSVVLLRCFCS